MVLFGYWNSTHFAYLPFFINPKSVDNQECTWPCYLKIATTIANANCNEMGIGCSIA